MSILCCFHKPFKLMGEGGWVAMTSPQDYGGQGMPFLDVMGDVIAGWMLLWRAVESIVGKNKVLEIYGLTETSAILTMNL